jgi:hypothetical protein
VIKAIKFYKRTAAVACASGVSEFSVRSARKRGALVQGVAYIVDNTGCALHTDTAAAELRERLTRASRLTPCWAPHFSTSRIVCTQAKAHKRTKETKRWFEMPNASDLSAVSRVG